MASTDNEKLNDDLKIKNSPKNIFNPDVIPDEIYGVKLSDASKKLLAQGGWSELLVGMHQDGNLMKDAKVQLLSTEDGEIKYNFQFKQQQLIIPHKIDDHELTEEEKRKLRNNELIGPILINKREAYLQVDNQLNAVTVRNPNGMDVSKIIELKYAKDGEYKIGNYELSHHEIKELCDGKQLKTHLYENDGNYFTARIGLTADKKGITFSEVQSIPNHLAQEYIEKFNNDSQNVRSAFSVGADVIVPTEQIKENTKETILNTESLQTPDPLINSVTKEASNSIENNQILDDKVENIKTFINEKHDFQPLSIAQIENSQSLIFDNAVKEKDVNQILYLIHTKDYYPSYEQRNNLNEFLNEAKEDYIKFSLNNGTSSEQITKDIQSQSVVIFPIQEQKDNLLKNNGYSINVDSFADKYKILLQTFFLIEKRLDLRSEILENHTIKNWQHDHNGYILSASERFDKALESSNFLKASHIFKSEDYFPNNAQEKEINQKIANLKYNLFEIQNEIKLKNIIYTNSKDQYSFVQKQLDQIVTLKDEIQIRYDNLTPEKLFDIAIAREKIEDINDLINKKNYIPTQEQKDTLKQLINFESPTIDQIKDQLILQELSSSDKFDLALQNRSYPQASNIMESEHYNPSPEQSAQLEHLKNEYTMDSMVFTRGLIGADLNKIIHLHEKGFEPNEQLINKVINSDKITPEQKDYIIALYQVKEIKAHDMQEQKTHHVNQVKPQNQMEI